ncbi:MAG: hypothetical protein AAFO84_06035 [Cyanobacteria bacterium J06598_1]
MIQKVLKFEMKLLGELVSRAAVGIEEYAVPLKNAPGVAADAVGAREESLVSIGL